MGYVHDTAMSQFIGPEDCQHSAGTWTSTNAANLWYDRRTAADANWVTRIPVKLPQNSVALKGSRLESIDIYFEISVGAIDAMAAAIYQAVLPADGAAFAAPTSLAFSYDTGHDAAGERIDADQHTMRLTLTTPRWLDNDDVIYVEITGDGSAAGVFDLYGARANFTLRL